MLAITAGGMALSALPGCAFIFSEGPPSPARQAAVTYFDCSENVAPPVVDTTLGLLFGLAALAASNDQSRQDRNATVGIDAGLAVLATASSIYGYRAVFDCQRATRARLYRQQRDRGLAWPYGLPPSGDPPPVWPPPWRMAAAPPVPARAVVAAPQTPPAPPVPPPKETPEASPPAAPPPAGPIFKPAPPAEPRVPSP